MKNSNLKVRTIDVDIRQDQSNVKDPGSILLDRADQKEINATIGKSSVSKQQAFEDLENKKAQNFLAASGITTNEVTINHQISILNEKGHGSAGSALSSANVERANERDSTVKIVVHDTEQSGGQTFRSSLDTAMGAVQQFQSTKVDGSQMESLEDRKTASKEFDVQVRSQNFKGNRMPIPIGQSALQQQAVNRAQTQIQNTKEEQSEDNQVKKRPRKRYYNGYGKVPAYMAQPIVKDHNRKISRIFSGKTWNRNTTNAGLSSASNHSTSLVQNNQNTQSGRNTHMPNSAYAFNFAGKDAKSENFLGQTIITNDNERPYTLNSEARIRNLSNISEMDLRFQRPASNIQVNDTNVTLDKNLAIQLAQEGAVLGISSAYREVSSLSKPLKNENKNSLLFTLDQYRWAQKQGVYEHKDSIGKNSLGRKIASSSAHTRRLISRTNMSLGNVIQSSNNPTRPSQGDFMMEEAAISHLMHRADNMPKIQFQLEIEKDDKFESHGSFGAYNTISKVTLDQQARFNNKGTKSLSSVGMKPKIKGMKNDDTQMSPIGKYLLHENETQDLLVSDTPLDDVAPYSNNPLVNNLLGQHNSNISIVNHGINLQPHKKIALQINKSQVIGNRNALSALNYNAVRADRKQTGKRLSSMITLTDVSNLDHNITENNIQNRNLQSNIEESAQIHGEKINEQEDQTFVSQNFAPMQNFSTINHQVEQNQNEDSVVIQNSDDEQNFKEKYQYKPKQGELHEGDIVLSSGNIYHEKKNPAIAKLLNTVQHNIQQSHNKRFERRQGKQRVFGMMKKTLEIFNQTLVEGEEQGHCKGVNDKNATDTLYQNRLRTQRFLQKQQDRYEEIRAKKPILEKQKLEAQKKRVQEKIARIEQAKKIVPDLKAPCLNTNGNHHHGQTTNSSDEESQGAQPQNQNSALTQNLFSPIETSAPLSIAPTRGGQSILSEQDFERAESGEQQQTIKAKRVQIDPNADTGANQEIQGAEGSVPISSIGEQNADLQGLDNTKEKTNLTVKTYSSVNMQKVGVQLLDIQAQQTSVSKHQSLSKTKKIHQKAQKKLKVLKDTLNLKNMSAEQSKAIEQMFMGRSATASPLLFGVTTCSNSMHLMKILKLLQQDEFITYKSSHNKSPGIIVRRNKIFTKTEQLGLEERPDFQAFFAPLCEDKTAYNPKLQRVKYRKFLQDRYSETVGEKILLFLENKFQTLFTFDKKGYCNVVMEFLNQGPELYKRLIFNCLSQANQGYICEHDVFALIENFKQRDSYYFYKELITAQDVPRDFKDAVDDSDEIFFEAFASDVKAIAKALNLKKRMHGIQDTDTNLTYKDDIDVGHYRSVEEYEEDLINQIDYLIGMINQQSSKYHEEITSILINEGDFKEIRTLLIELIADNELFSKRDKKTDTSSQRNQASQDNKRACQVPCLGSGLVTDTGKKIQTDCCYLTFEDFNKLVIFKKGRHSSFVEDLIDHMSNSLISVHDVEFWCGYLRDSHCKQVFTGRNVVEYVAQMNIKEYGNSRGQPPPQAHVKKQRLGIVADTLPHTITTPYTLQDHYSGEDYMGKLIIRKIPKEQAENRGGLSARKSQLEATEGHPASHEASDEDDGPQDGEECSPTSPGKSPMVLNTFLVSDESVSKLIAHRNFFGAPNFFRIFRIYYQLAVVPDDAQNNPFALFLDQHSLVKNFRSVFGVEQEEVAVRFFKLFIAPLGQPKMYKIDIMRWYYVIQELCDNGDPKRNHNYLTLAFNFLDYDQSGSIGSVDIHTLKKSLESKQTEEVQVAFERFSVEKQFGVKFKKFAGEIQDSIVSQAQKQKRKSSKKPQNPNQPPASILQKKPNDRLPSDSSHNLENHKKVQVLEDEEQEEQEKQRSEAQIGPQTGHKPSNPIGLSSHDEAVLGDAWNHFLIEVLALRDYYIDQAVKCRNPRTTDYEFFTQKVYDLKFLPIVNSKYELNTPAIVNFLKQTLCYEFEVVVDLEKEKKKLYHGFTMKGYKEPQEIAVTKELEQMQEMLFQMSSVPRPPFSDL